ncbi:MAG TPA: ATP-binding protein [Stellaceae bacterium]|nr:ATP-binding protein [Stellaceae bacterium]
MASFPGTDQSRPARHHALVSAPRARDQDAALHPEGGEDLTRVDQFAISPLTLRFVNDRTERRFRMADLARGLTTIRVFLVAAFLLFGAFGILDLYVIPEVRGIAWIIRYVVVCPFLLSVVLLTYSPRFARMAQLALSSCMFACGIGILVMIALAAPAGSALYYAGLIMVVIYGASLVRLRWTTAAAISLLLVALYEIVALYANPISARLVISNDFFLCMSVAVGVFSGYVQELQSRRDFVSTELLWREKARSDRLLEEAEAASRSKSNFLAMMSHELRTPLNAILGFSEIMQRRMFGPIGSERYASYVEDIHHTAQHLLSVITDILDLSKAEVGKLTLNEQDVDLFAVLDQCFRLLRDRAAENGLRLSLEAIDDTRPILRLDPTLIKQVVINILGNAIKFTPAGGSVSGRLALDHDGSWLVTFTDTGIGIAEADLPRIVEPFVQVESAFVQKHGGAGLGLPLVKKIAELHGGSIAIKSKLGAGTTVIVRIPRERLVRTADRAVGAA